MAVHSWQLCLHKQHMGHFCNEVFVIARVNATGKKMESRRKARLPGRCSRSGNKHVPWARFSFWGPHQIDFTLCLLATSPCGSQSQTWQITIHSPLLAEPATKKSTGKLKVRALKVWDQEQRGNTRGCKCTWNTRNHLSVPGASWDTWTYSTCCSVSTASSVSSAASWFGSWREQLICCSFLAGSGQFGSVLHTAPQQTSSGGRRW